LDSDDLIALWDRIALSKNEDLALRALRFLDPDIERIAAQATTQTFYGVAFRGGFIVKSRGYEQPIPIGSFGDGMWRMLAMAIAISQCRGGVLLVDEIDTGLHYTVLPDMWRLIMEAARDLDVQVVATTHSSDCIAALASICASDRLLSDSTTVHRVERNSRYSIPYSGSDIMNAVDKHVEVR
jgi:predicted ATPase